MPPSNIRRKFIFLLSTSYFEFFQLGVGRKNDWHALVRFRLQDLVNCFKPLNIRHLQLKTNFVKTSQNWHRINAWVYFETVTAKFD